MLYKKQLIVGEYMMVERGCSSDMFELVGIYSAWEDAFVWLVGRVMLAGNCPKDWDANCLQSLV